MPPPRKPSAEITLPHFNPRIIQAGVLLVLLIWGGWTAFYTVPAESVGVVQRFGKMLDETSPPGLHFMMPFGIDAVTPVPVQRQLKLEFGFQTAGGTNEAQYGREPQREMAMVTGDLNAALVEWVVQYRVDDPRHFLFHVNNPGQTLRDLSEAVMREVIGDRTVDEVITIGRQEIEISAKEKLAKVVKDYELGIAVDQVQLKNVNPPLAVRDSFNQVNQAQQDRENLINLASGEYNKVVPKARGEADQKIRGAEGYRLKRINEAEGDVASFSQQLEQYVKAPGVTRTRLYLETLGEVMPQAGPKIIVDDAIKQLTPLLPGGAVVPVMPAGGAK